MEGDGDWLVMFSVLRKQIQRCNDAAMQRCKVVGKVGGIEVRAMSWTRNEVGFRRIGVTFLLAVLLVIAGCVTVVENPRPRGVILKPDGTRVQAGQAGAGGSGVNQQANGASGVGSEQGALSTPVTPMQLPTDGTIAQPVTSGSMTSRVQVTVVPLGIVGYDGQTLPLVSPDGRFVVVQNGGAPTWATILATQGQTASNLTRIDVFEVTDKGLKQLTSSVPRGVVMGRDATTQGFLIESVQASGARWIGEVRWATGEVKWLVQTSAINSHASWLRGRDGEDALVFTRRAIGEDQQGSLVVLHKGEERIAANGALWFATAAPSGDAVYACNISNGLVIEAFGVNREGGRVRVSGPIAKRTLSKEGDPAMAYQVFASLQPGAWSAGQGGTISACNMIGLIDPDAAREAVYDFKAGTLRPLGNGTVASVWWDEVDSGAAGAAGAAGGAGSVGGVRATGYFLTSREGLVFLPENAVGANVEPARVLASPYVPRAVRDSRGASLLCFGPGKGGATQLEVLRVVVGGAAKP